MDEFLDAWEPQEPPDDFAERVVAAARRPVAPKLDRWFAALAVAGVAVVLGFFILAEEESVPVAVPEPTATAVAPAPEPSAPELATKVPDDPAMALRHFKKAVEADPSDPSLQIGLAKAAIEMREFETANRALEAVMESDPRNADALWLVGVVSQKTGLTDRALLYLQAALDRGSKRAEVHATMARCYQDQADATRAKEAWRTALSIDPNVAEWHFRLAKLLVNDNRMKEATPHLRKAYDMAGNSKPGWLWNAAYLLMQALRDTDKPKALAACERFLKLTSRENAYRDEVVRECAKLKAALASPAPRPRRIPPPKREPAPFE